MTTAEANPYDVVRNYVDAFWDDPGLFAMMVYDTADHYNYDIDDVVAVIQSNSEWAALLNEGIEEIDEWRAIRNTRLRENLEKNLTRSLPSESKPVRTSLEQSKTMGEIAMQLQQNVLNLVSSVVDGLTANVTNGIQKISNAYQSVKKRLKGVYVSMVRKEMRKS